MLKIVIQTDADFTPQGKRSARTIRTLGGGRQLRWYVSGRIYHRLPVTAGNINLTRQWLDSQKGTK